MMLCDDESISLIRGTGCQRAHFVLSRIVHQPSTDEQTGCAGKRKFVHRSPTDFWSVFNPMATAVCACALAGQR